MPCEGVKDEYPGRWFPCGVDSRKHFQTLPRVVTALIGLKIHFASYAALMKSTHSWPQNERDSKRFDAWLCHIIPRSNSEWSTAGIPVRRWNTEVIGYPRECWER